MKKIIIDDEIFSIQNTFGGISRLITEYIAMFDNDEEDDLFKEDDSFGDKDQSK